MVSLAKKKSRGGKESISKRQRRSVRKRVDVSVQEGGNSEDRVHATESGHEDDSGPGEEIIAKQATTESAETEHGGLNGEGDDFTETRAAEMKKVEKNSKRPRSCVKEHEAQVGKDGDGDGDGVEDTAGKAFAKDESEEGNNSTTADLKEQADQDTNESAEEKDGESGGMAPKQNGQGSTSVVPKPTKGIIYISRLPPGMEVTAVRTYLSRIGGLGRIWLRRESDQALSERRLLSSGRRNAEFRDGWVEFSKRRDARRCVDLLNGQPMRGGKRRGRWGDDLWCVRYLKGVRWEDLRETGRERVLKVREEVAAARREKSFVEERVGLARKVGGGGKDGERKAVRRFRQKGVVREKEWEVDADVDADVDEERARLAAERMERGEESAGLDEELVGMLFKRRKVG